MKLNCFSRKITGDSKKQEPQPPRERWIRDLFGKITEQASALFGRARVSYAIDLGAHSLKAVAFSRRFGRTMIHWARMASFGERFDYTCESGKRRQLLKEALLEIFDSQQRMPGKLRIVMPSAAAFIRLTKLPLIRGRVQPGSVAYELKEKIPYPLEDLAWDFLGFARNGGSSGSVLLAAARREAVCEILEITDELGFQAQEITDGPSVLFEAFRKKLGQGETILLLDVGAYTLDLLAMNRDGFWSRTIGQGCSRILEALEKETGIPREEIERKMKDLKLEDKLGHALRGKLQALAEEIERTITIYRQEVREPRFTGLLVAGGAAEFPGLIQFLSEKLGIPLKDNLLPAAMRRVGRPIYFRAAALALNPKIPINLLPSEEKGRRGRMKLKQIFSLTLAGILLALGVSLGIVFSYSAVKAEAIHQIEKEISSANSLRKEIEKVQESLTPWRTLFGESLARFEGRDLPMGIIRELEQILPRAVWLERMHYERAEGKVTLEGTMHEKLTSVTSLVNAFGPSALFGRVSVNEGSVEPSGKRRFTCAVEVKRR